MTTVFFFWIPIIISAYSIIYKYLVSSLKQSRIKEEEYKSFLDNSIQAVWVYTSDPPMPLTISFEEQVEWLYQNVRLEKCNDTYARMYGFSSASDISGKRIIDVFGGHEQSVRSILRSFVEGNYALNMTETHEIIHDGAEVWHLYSSYSQFENGMFCKAIGFSIDITEIKKTELEVGRLAMVVEKASEIVVITDTGGTINYVNPAFIEVTGYSSDEAIG